MASISSDSSSISPSLRDLACERQGYCPTSPGVSSCRIPPPVDCGFMPTAFSCSFSNDRHFDVVAGLRRVDWWSRSIDRATLDGQWTDNGNCNQGFDPRTHGRMPEQSYELMVPTGWGTAGHRASRRQISREALSFGNSLTYFCFTSCSGSRSVTKKLQIVWSAFRSWLVFPTVFSTSYCWPPGQVFPAPLML